MALRLRRGTDFERGTVVFEQGELVYTIDTQSLWIGDGATAGGTLVSNIGSPIALTQDLDLNNSNISGTGTIGDVNTSFVGDGSALTNVSGITEGSFYRIGIVGDDSTQLVDPATNTVNGLHTGNGSGLTDISINGISDFIITAPTEGEILTYSGGQWTNLSLFDGDVRGSVFGDDSTLIVDAVNSIINTNFVTSSAQKLTVQKTGVVEPFEFNVIGNGNTTGIRIITQSDNNLTGTLYSGKLFFGYKDPTGSSVTVALLGAEDALYIVANSSGNFTSESSHLTWQQPGKLGLGTYTPAQELDVRGNAVVTGFVQFGSLTTTERNTIVAAAGMVIWNSTTTQFEGYNGSNWINLIDGVISA